jgi:hypothetical protein
MKLNRFIKHAYKEILILILILMTEQSHNCPLNIYEWFDYFNTNNNLNKKSECCTIVCCPIKTPILLLILPCTFYNICMNKYNNKYIC